MTISFRLECRECMRHRYIAALTKDIAAGVAAQLGWLVDPAGDTCPRCIATRRTV